MPDFLADSLIKALSGNSLTGMCRCPAHDDTNPSFQVSTGKNGKILFRCHAGCSQDAVLAALKARGLWSRKNPISRLEKENVTLFSKREKDMEDYERFHRAFSVLYIAASANAGAPSDYLKCRAIKATPPCAMLLPKEETARLFGKRFPAMVVPISNAAGKLQGAHVTFLDKSGCRKLTGDKQKRILGKSKGGYAQLSEPEPDKPLIIGEGIETTLSAMQIAGLPAVAALSAGNMATLEPLPCGEIIIAADNDDAGLRAAEKLALRLTTPERPIRIAIPPGPKGTDWNDVLRSNKNIKELRNIILNTEPYKTLKQNLVLSTKEFLEIDVPKPDYFLRPWLTTGSTGMIHAARGAGKTWFVLSAAYSVATGKPLLGWPVERVAKVLYVDAELPINYLQERLRQLGPPSPNLLILSMESAFRQNATLPDLATQEGQKFFDDIIEEHNPELIIFDPLTELIRSGAENESESWRPVQSWMLRQRFRGRTIILSHHEGKGGTQRGTSKREDILDVMVGLKSLSDLSTKDENLLELRFSKARRFYGADAAPRIMHLSTKFNQIEWRQEAKGSSKQEQVEKMLEQGITPKIIAEATGLKRPRISQIKKEMLLRKKFSV